MRGTPIEPNFDFSEGGESGIPLNRARGHLLTFFFSSSVCRDNSGHFLVLLLLTFRADLGKTEKEEHSALFSQDRK